MSISAISPVGAAPPAPVVAPVIVAARAVTTTPPVAAPANTAAAPASQLTGDAGELVQSYGGAALAHALIAYPPIPIGQPQPAVPPVAPVLPAGFTAIDTYA